MLKEIYHYAKRDLLTQKRTTNVGVLEVLQYTYTLVKETYSLVKETYAKENY